MTVMMMMMMTFNITAVRRRYCIVVLLQICDHAVLDFAVKSCVG